MRPRNALHRWTVDRQVTDAAGATERAPAPLFEGAAELKWVVAAASLAMFVVALDFFSVQAAIPDMAADLDTTASALQWVISGYLLAAGAFLIVGGRVGDIFGRRRVLIAGSAVFGTAALIGGASDSAAVVIVMRTVQGAASAFMVPVALAITTTAFPPERIQRAVGLVFGISSSGQAFGPVVGGMLVESISWRGVLWINVPVAAAVIALLVFWVEESRDESAPRSIDAAGLIASVVSIVLFTYGVDRAATAGGHRRRRWCSWSAGCWGSRRSLRSNDVRRIRCSTSACFGGGCSP